MPWRLARKLLWPGLALALGACAGVGPAAISAYQGGYQIGCIDGEITAGRPISIFIDDLRIERDAEYAAGFKDGQRDCYEAFMRHPHTWNGSGR